MITSKLKWTSNGIFLILILYGFIGVFQEVINSTWSFYLKFFELIFIYLSIFAIIFNFYDLKIHQTAFQSINPVASPFIFYLINIGWGILSIGFLVGKTLQFYYVDIYYFPFLVFVYSSRILHVLLLSLWSIISYKRIPRNSNSIGFVSHNFLITVNIVALTYYFYHDKMVSVSENIWKSSNESNSEQRCQIYNGFLKKFCQNQSLLESFFSAFVFISILLLSDISTDMKSNIDYHIRKMKSQFYKKRNEEKPCRKWYQSLIAIFLSLIMIILTLTSIIFFYNNSNEKWDLNFYTGSNLIIYLIGVFESIVLIFEMKNWKFSNKILSPIDSLILEIGTFNKLFIVINIIVSCGLIINSGDREDFYYFTIIDYIVLLIQLCLQRTIIIQLIKMSHNIGSVSESKFIQQFCPTMVLMTLNLCLIPTSYFFMIHPIAYKSMQKSVNNIAWVTFKSTFAPISILHRFHGAIVFGYTLYQTW